MDLLYVVGQFPKISESFVINEIHELDKRGHNVSVFAMRRPEEEITHSEVQKMDVNIHYGDTPSLKSALNLFNRNIFNPSIMQEACYIDHPVFHASCLHKGKQIIDFIDAENGVDLIHAHFATPNRLAAKYAAAYHEIPCTVTAHANDIFSAPNVRRLQRVCSRFDHIVVPSYYNKKHLANNIGVDTEMTVVPATTSTDKFEPSDGCIPGRLLTIARFVEKKGHKYAINAVAKLVEQGHVIDYHMIGSGEREEMLREQVRQQGLTEHISFLGNVSDERLLEELHEAAIFVLPCVITNTGDRDITPVALREAMATQTACVSTTISAIPEVITDGHDGILVEPNNSEAIAEAIAELLENPSQREQLAENARNTIETKFDIQIAVNQLESVFKSLKYD